MSDHHYEGFPHAAAELSAYIFCIDTFVIALKNEQIIRHVAPDPEDFIRWLGRHGIRDVRQEIGSLIYNSYFE